MAVTVTRCWLGLVWFGGMHWQQGKKEEARVVWFVAYSLSRRRSGLAGEIYWLCPYALAFLRVFVSPFVLRCD